MHIIYQFRENIYNLTYKFTKHQTFEISLTRDILLKKLWAKKKEIKTKKELISIKIAIIWYMHIT